MQELAITPEPGSVNPEVQALLQRIDADLKQLTRQIEQQGRSGSSGGNESA